MLVGGLIGGIGEECCGVVDGVEGVLTWVLGRSWSVVLVGSRSAMEGGGSGALFAPSWTRFA